MAVSSMQDETSLRNRFFVVRHGQSESNVENILVSDPAVGRASYGLTEKGKQQAREACDRLVRALSTSSSSGGPGSSDDCDCSTDLDLLAERVVVVSSDFKRTRETAEIIHSGLGAKAPLRFSPALWERGMGELESKAGPNVYQLWEADGKDPSHKHFGCESVMEMMVRLSRLVRDLDGEEAEEGGGGGGGPRVYVLVSHADPLRVLQSVFLGVSPSDCNTVPHLSNGQVAELVEQKN